MTDSCIAGEHGGTVSKVQLHADICKNLNGIYQRKNNDYGDSFAKLRNELTNAILVRIYDKYSRLKTLLQGKEQLVNDESIDDTLMDLANYCIMELVERQVDNMEINEYQKLALRTANNLDSKELMLNCIFGLCGEAGEVSDHIKKALFQGHELNEADLANELGDVCWYLAILAKSIHIDLETVMKMNIAKFEKRYPDGFKVEDSINRKDVGQ